MMSKATCELLEYFTDQVGERTVDVCDDGNCPAHYERMEGYVSKNKQPQVPKKNEVSLVRSSAAEYLTFAAADDGKFVCPQCGALVAGDFFV